MAVGETKHYPKFEGRGAHRSGTLVYGEALCVCGGIRRIRGAVEDVADSIESFNAVHSGAGHSPTTDKVEVARARERTRYQGFVQARTRESVEDIPYDATYEPTNWDEKNFGVTSAEVFADGFLASIEAEEDQYRAALTEKEGDE